VVTEPHRDMKWHAGNNQSVLLAAEHSLYVDDEVPLKYHVKHDPWDGTWTASFEGGVLCRGSLSECFAACEQDERVAEKDNARETSNQ